MRRQRDQTEARAAIASRCVLAGSAPLAALSLLAPSQPSYDPWAWLVWGREVAALDLDTVAGPAWKPLPVAITALLSLAGDAAPALWLVVARAGAIAAVLLAARLAWRLAGGSWVAARRRRRRRRAQRRAGSGMAPSATPRACSSRSCSPRRCRRSTTATGRALALGVLAALLRPEAWPFLGAYGLWLWLRRPALRAWAAGGRGALRVAWFVPEWLASGDPLRSSERARIPNPGAPATAARPLLASLERAAAIPLPPLVAAALVPARPGRAAAAAAAARRRARRGRDRLGRARRRDGRGRLLGRAALRAARRGADRRQRRRGAGRPRRRPARRGGRRGPAHRGRRRPAPRRRADRVAYRRRRGRALRLARRCRPRAGGRAALLACGRPVVGRLRGPALAYALGVHKRRVAFDPALGGPVFRSRIRAGRPCSPRSPRRCPCSARSARWEVRGACDG